MAAFSPYASPPTQFRGLSDLFPSLGKFIQGNREKVMAPQRARSLAKAEGLLGQEGTSFDQFGQGDTAGFDQVQEPTGLMADPESFYNQMKYSLGLMGTPGYQQAGQDFARQAMQSQLGMSQARQDQANWQANQARLQSETDAAEQRALATEQRAIGSEARQQGTADFNKENALYKDYVKAAAPYRTTADLMTNVQQVVSEKGFEQLSMIDDVQLVKSYAKMLLPNEAVMEGDISALTKVDMTKNPELGIVRSVAAKLAGGIPLTAQERENLYGAMHRIAGNSYNNYAKLRQGFEERAAGMNLNPDNVRRADMAPGGYQSLLPSSQAAPVLTETGTPTGTIDYNDPANRVGDSGGIMENVRKPPARPNPRTPGG